MKLSERLKHWEETALSCEGFWPDNNDIQHVQELEQKAALWDKVSGLPQHMTIRSLPPFDRKSVAWQISIASNCFKAINAGTLEEALNAIPEVQS